MNLKRIAPLGAPLTANVALSATVIWRMRQTIAGQTGFVLVDDAMISMRYGRNLAHGHGLVWNTTGPRVEGYSNFLWTLWMAVVHLLPLPDRLTSLPIMLSSAIAMAATVVMAYLLARRLVPESTVGPACAAWLVALYFSLAFWSLRGMEVGFAAVLLVTLAWLAVGILDRPTTRDLIPVATCAAIAVLVRDDLLLPVALVVGYLVLRGGDQRERRRRAFCLGGPVAAVLAAHTIFRMVYYGSALPNTYYLKLGQVPLGGRLHRGVVALVNSGVTELWAPLLLACIGLFVLRSHDRRTELWLLAMIVFAVIGYSVYVGGDIDESGTVANRFLSTVAPILLVLSALGVDAIVRHAQDRRGAVVAVAIGSAAFGALNLHNWSNPAVLQKPGYHVDWFRPGVAIALAAISVAVAFGLGFGRHSSTRAATMLLATIFLATSGEGLWSWRDANLEGLWFETALADQGVQFRHATAPGATIAGPAIGALGYFSQREIVDELGKTDTVIAHERSHPGEFWPGHSKYDIERSIAQARPDVVAALWPGYGSNAACRAKSYGYVLVGAFLVRSDTALVDRAALVDVVGGIDSASVASLDRCP